MTSEEEGLTAEQEMHAARKAHRMLWDRLLIASRPAQKNHLLWTSHIMRGNEAAWGVKLDTVPKNFADMENLRVVLDAVLEYHGVDLETITRDAFRHFCALLSGPCYGRTRKQSLHILARLARDLGEGGEDRESLLMIPADLVGAMYGVKDYSYSDFLENGTAGDLRNW